MRQPKSASLLSTVVRVFQLTLVLLIAGVVDGGVARVSICADRPSEKEDEWLGVVNAIVDPAARLLDSEVAPLLLRQ